MITIEEVIEEVAEECEVMGRAWAIRTLKAKYEGCIVAESAPEVYCYQLLVEDQVVNELFVSINWDVRLKPFGRSGVDHGGVATKTPLYRAKEPTK
jgi:hypothetical protein